MKIIKILVAFIIFNGISISGFTQTSHNAPYGMDLQTYKTVFDKLNNSKEINPISKNDLNLQKFNPNEVHAHDLNMALQKINNPQAVNPISKINSNDSVANNASYMSAFFNNRNHPLSNQQLNSPAAKIGISQTIDLSSGVRRTCDRSGNNISCY